MEITQIEITFSLLLFFSVVNKVVWSQRFCNLLYLKRMYCKLGVNNRNSTNVLLSFINIPPTWLKV